MKITIAGGTGLIGKELVNDLSREGHHITVLSRSPENYRDQFAENVRLVYWDGRSVGDWAAHVDGVDAVVNLAGESISGAGFLPDRWTADKKQRIQESRLAAGRTLTMAVEAADTKPDVFIQTSAVGYYGSTGDTVVTETSPPGTDFLASVCVDWENSSIGVEALGVRRVLTRIGLVLSTEEGALPRLLLPFRLFVGGTFGKGDQWWSWIHIYDTVRAIRYSIMSETIQGPVNITSPHPVTNREFGRVLGRVLDRPSIMPVPAAALRIGLGEVASTVLEGQRVMPQLLLDNDFRFLYPDLDMALKNLIQ